VSLGAQFMTFRRASILSLKASWFLKTLQATHPVTHHHIYVKTLVFRSGVYHLFYNVAESIHCYKGHTFSTGYRPDRMFTSCHHRRPNRACLGCHSLFLALNQPLTRICTKLCGSRWLVLCLLYLLLRLQPLIMPRTGE
jgi:hypothetical protein